MTQIVEPPLVQLVLVEVFGILVSGLDAVGRLEWALAVQGRHCLLDPVAFAVKQLACALRVHG